MLVDDLGWSDLGCYGSEIRTPNIDALAAGGMRFREFYNSARCSPTRFALLTGLYPQQGAVNPSASLPDLRNDNNVTFAELPPMSPPATPPRWSHWSTNGMRGRTGNPGVADCFIDLDLDGNVKLWFVQIDNFAVRVLRVAAPLAVEHALAAGLDGALTDPAANPDGDRLDNFGEWAFGTDPGTADDVVSATSLVLAAPSSGTVRFAHRRLAGSAAAGVVYRYEVSQDLETWQAANAVGESASPLPASPGYEVVTLALPDGQVTGATHLFLRVSAE